MPLPLKRMGANIAFGSSPTQTSEQKKFRLRLAFFTPIQLFSQSLAHYFIRLNVLFVTVRNEVKKNFACGGLSFAYFNFAHFFINVLFVTVTKEVKEIFACGGLSLLL